MTTIYTLAQAALLCLRIGAHKAPDLAPTWLPVCVDIAERASATTVRPALAVATGWHESRFDPHVIGRAGEVGAMQCNPNAHDCHDPIGVALRVLEDRVTRFGEARGVCAYRGAALDCRSPRVALADRIEVGR
jgi:hypothetical protein